MGLHAYESAIQAALVNASALLLAAIGLFALLRRGQWLTTLLFSSAFLSLAAFEAGTLGMVNAGSEGALRTWAVYLARNSALVSWLWLTLSVVLGRPRATPGPPRRGCRSATPPSACTRTPTRARRRPLRQRTGPRRPHAGLRGRRLHHLRQLHDGPQRLLPEVRELRRHQRLLVSCS